MTKRPLLHPPIPSKYASNTLQKPVYISAKTPFMSAVKRVQRLLAQVEKREMQSATSLIKNESRKRKRGGYGMSGRDQGEEEMSEIAKVAAKLAEGNEGKAEGEGKVEVVLKATGKAIAKAMSLGVWFQDKEEYGILVRTGTVGAIDDITIEEEEVEKGGEDEMDVDGAQTRDKKDDDVGEVPETRIRYASTIEIAVFKR